MFRQICHTWLLLALLLLTGCTSDSPFLVYSEIPDAHAEISVPAPQDDRDLLDYMDAFSVGNTLKRYFAELYVLRDEIATTFGGIVYDNEQIILYSTAQDEDTAQLYWDNLFPTLKWACLYPKTGLAPCDFSLGQLYETFTQAEALQDDWLLSVQLDVRANRIAIYVSEWSRRIEKTLLSSISAPERCIIVRAEPATSEVTILQNPGPTSEEFDAQWKAFWEKSAADHLSEGEMIDRRANMIAAVKNHMLFYPAHSWQSQLLSDWQLTQSGVLGWRISQETIPNSSILVYHPWEERYTALLETACASVPETIFWLSIPLGWESKAP